MEALHPAPEESTFITNMDDGLNYMSQTTPILPTINEVKIKVNNGMGQV